LSTIIYSGNKTNFALLASLKYLLASAFVVATSIKLIRAGACKILVGSEPLKIACSNL
jgi:hypothetical protein